MNDNDSWWSSLFGGRKRGRSPSPPPKRTALMRETSLVWVRNPTASTKQLSEELLSRMQQETSLITHREIMAIVNAIQMHFGIVEDVLMEDEWQTLHFSSRGRYSDLATHQKTSISMRELASFMNVLTTQCTKKIIRNLVEIAQRIPGVGGEVMTGSDDKVWITIKLTKDDDESLEQRLTLLDKNHFRTPWNPTNEIVRGVDTVEQSIGDFVGNNDLQAKTISTEAGTVYLRTPNNHSLYVVHLISLVGELQHHISPLFYAHSSAVFTWRATNLPPNVSSTWSWCIVIHYDHDI